MFEDAQLFEEVHILLKILKAIFLQRLKKCN